MTAITLLAVVVSGQSRHSTHLQTVEAVCILPSGHRLTVSLGSLTNPDIACAGVSLNTAALAEREAADVLLATQDRLGLPCADPMRSGAALERLVDACLA